MRWPWQRKREPKVWFWANNGWGPYDTAEEADAVNQRMADIVEQEAKNWDALMLHLIEHGRIGPDDDWPTRPPVFS